MRAKLPNMQPKLTRLTISDQPPIITKVHRPDNRVRVTAAIMSLTLHVILLIGLGLASRGGGQYITDPNHHTAPANSLPIATLGVDANRDATISTRHGGSPTPTSQSHYQHQHQDAPSSPAGTTNEPLSLAELLPESGVLPIDIRGMLPGDEGSLSSAATIVTPNASSFTSINQSNRSAKDYPIQTSVFGVTGTGSKFVYIFDRSASMTDLDGLPMRAAKSHLVASLVTLDDVHQFQIIFYNDRLTFFNPRAPLPPGLLFASEGVKRQAVSFVRDIAADGGTNHIDALNRGIALQPDVIFFLTDADDPQLSSADLSEIRRRNKGTIINTVEFGAGAEPKTERTLANLARENGGQYVYVDVLNLKAHP